MHIPLSITILTKNSERHIHKVLISLQSFDEVVLYDTGSQDRTLDIARQFKNVVIYFGEFIGFGPTHNMASSLARNDWIISIDSDEVLSPALREEIQSLLLNRGQVYSFPRHNEYGGKWIRTCGWYPDRVIRMYNRLDTHFNDAQVHESIILQNVTEICLSSPLLHYSYDQVSDFLDKMQSYSSLFALQNQGKKSSSFGKAIAHGVFAFLKSFFLKKGFLQGQEGFEISIYNANTAFYKYMKLAEANRALRKKKSDSLEHY